MNNLLVEHPALKECLNGLGHLFIDIARLKHEPHYGERRGGFCDLQVATLDSEIPSGSKLVATKKLFLGFRSNEPLRLAVRLARELKVWAALRHPHVLPVLGFYLGNDYQTAMLISEYMTYGDLEGYIAKVKPASSERLHLVRDLTDGLAYLHTQTPSIRHGDLKPGNVLVNPERRALLADFGLSKALDAGPSGFTTGNDTRGTVRFSCPEILLDGEGGQSLANDIWSWACLVLEVLTDKIPFAEIRFEPQLIAALMKGRTPCATEILAHHLPQFNDLFAKCWDQEPNQRPAAGACLSCIESEVLFCLVNQQPQPGQPERPMQFHEFFTKAFNGWVAQRQLTLDPPHVDGKEVELHKLFLMVGALGGYRAVYEKKLWPVVGAKIGFTYFYGPLPCSKPEVADQLSKIYQKILADFEVHWHNSLRPRDPTSIFPLPPQFQYLHPEIERVATAQFPLQQQQQQPQQQQPPQRPRLPDANARGPTPNQMGQQTPQMGQTQAATQQQEAIMRNQPGVAFPPQPGPSGQGGPMGLPTMPNLPPMLQQLFANPDILKFSPEDLKRRGLSDEVIQKVLVYRQHVVAKQIQTRKEQELMLQQQRQIQAQQAANLLNSQKETPQLAPGNQPSPALGGPQIGLGPGLQTSAPVQPPQLPSSVPLLPGLNVPHDQLMKAQEKVRAAIGLFHNKRDYSSINLPHEQGILLEQSIQHWQTQIPLKQVVQNLVPFAILAPNDERELNQVAQIVVTLADQAQILQKPPPEKRFIFGLGDLNNYRNHLTTFLMRIKGLQGEAMALQNQRNSDTLPFIPQPVAQQEHASAPFQSVAQIPMRYRIAELPRLPISEQRLFGPITQPHLLPQASVAPPNPGPTTSFPSLAASTYVNQAPTPAEPPNTQKSPAIGSKGALNKSRPLPNPQIPVKRSPTKPALKIPHEVPGASRLQAERPPSKREREGDVTGLDGSAGRSGLHKRARTDPQDPDRMRNGDTTTAEQLTIEGSLEYLEKTVKDYENGATEPSAAAPPTIESLLQILDQGVPYDVFADRLATIPELAAAPVPSQEVPVPGVKLEEEEDDLCWAAAAPVPSQDTPVAVVKLEEEEADLCWDIDSSQRATEDPAVGETPDLVPSVSSQGLTPNSDSEPDAPDFWALIGVPEGRYYPNDTEWKWEGKMESDRKWPISYPVV